jgi:hypothetical protein
MDDNDDSRAMYSFGRQSRCRNCGAVIAGWWLIPVQLLTASVLTFVLLRFLQGSQFFTSDAARKRYSSQIPALTG